MEDWSCRTQSDIHRSVDLRFTTYDLRREASCHNWLQCPKISAVLSRPTAELQNHLQLELKCILDLFLAGIIRIVQFGNTRSLIFPLVPCFDIFHYTINHAAFEYFIIKCVAWIANDVTFNSFVGNRNSDFWLKNW